MVVYHVILVFNNENFKKDMDWIFITSTKKGMEEYGTIAARVRSNGMEYQYAIGFCIKEQDWKNICAMSYVANNVLAGVGMTYSMFVSMLGRIRKVIEDDATEPHLIPVLIRSVKDDILKSDGKSHSAAKGKILLSECMARYRDDMISGKRLKRGKAVKVSTGYVINIEKALKVLLKYEEFSHRKTCLDKVTMDFQRSFVAFMRNQGLRQNTIYTRMSVVRVVMQAAYMDRLTRKDDFRNSEFVPPQEKVDSVWFTTEQIEELRTLNLSNVAVVKELYTKVELSRKAPVDFPRPDRKLVRYLAYARDVFVVGCLTGQRYSDYKRICKDMVVKIDGQEFYSLRQVKTQNMVLIPVDVRVGEILDRYGGRLPDISQATFGKHIKLLAELLGWTHIPEFDRQGEDVPKKRFCDMVTTHTCRRSFATNAYAAGIPLCSIMALTGHTSEKNLRRYLKLQAEDKALIAAKDFDGFIQSKP